MDESQKNEHKCQEALGTLPTYYIEREIPLTYIAIAPFTIKATSREEAVKKANSMSPQKIIESAMDNWDECVIARDTYKEIRDILDALLECPDQIIIKEATDDNITDEVYDD